MFKQALALSFFQAVATAAPAGTPVQAAAVPPATFTANPNIGPGGSSYIDSPHFRVYGATGTTGTNAANMLEAAYSCFVDTLGWRSSGLSFDDASDTGPYTKVNAYSVSSLSGNAAGVMHSDAGMSWLEIVNSYLTNPSVTVHEYGHGLTYAAKTWVDQGNTGAWWETVANWVADTYKTSPICASARSKYGQSTSATEINLATVIGESYLVLVDGAANYYEQWPFLSYLTYNPDSFSGLGQSTVYQGFAQYSKNSNETPLHTYARLLKSGTIQKVVGRYWARMAFADIGHPTAQSVFLAQRNSLNYANLDSQGSGVYKAKSARQPRYMGANIIPLKKSGTVTVTAKITTSGSYTATLSIRNTSTGATRYVDFASGSASASVSSNEEAMVVVANTPALIVYDPFNIPSTVSKGLDYTLTLTGATA
ncbi:hypothetical protein P171DRAFT_436588 [Karstenula rhodostoma CBS 690.94]|uniref:Dockerin type 1 n=1 Tax=Karstenula rhodostoma CBS 690.94 TaxID=1392251 RepID=A0A9P4P892_9PLEO|nr:hypothetical protein P171DRAFT_436588 [Karstenula rhodostoma CBS 690.94]